MGTAWEEVSSWLAYYFDTRTAGAGEGEADPGEWLGHVEKVWQKVFEGELRQNGGEAKHGAVGEGCRRVTSTRRPRSRELTRTAVPASN